jgi:hypothetical protein
MSVRVAVRVRPFSDREVQLGAECVVSMQGNTTYLHDEREVRPFTFDHSFWSHNPEDDHFASQEHVYDCLGSQILDDVFAGYNACLFAYGQTGSGKSYSMMGYGNEAGMIPRLCDNLFRRMRAMAKEKAADASSTWNSKVEVSYMEIYLERVRDLLPASGDGGSSGYLRVREHARTGPYVENLSSHPVENYEMVRDLMDEGNKARPVVSCANVYSPAPSVPPQ